MKKYLFLLLCLLSISSAFAQSPKNLKVGDNFKDDNLDRFEGDWIWSNGRDTIKIYLKKSNVEISPGIRADMLVGYHQYVQNGKLVENSYQFRNVKDASKKQTFSGTSEKGQPNKIKGLLTNSSNGSLYSVNLELKPSTNILTISSTGDVPVKIPTSESSKKDVGSGYRFPNSVSLSLRK